jgi:mono/diheme cytochrome c family protein
MNPKRNCLSRWIPIAVLLVAVPFGAFATAMVEEAPVTEEEVAQLIRTSQAEFAEALADTCGQCHGAETKYPVAGAQLGYSHSGHYLGWDKQDQNSWYSNGNGCQRCHTSEGFVEYVKTGTVEGFVDYPSQPGCFACHDPHNTFDFSLRTTEPVDLAAGFEYDGGNGNLCANCHQARRSVEASVEAGTLSSHFGPHHGPEADMILGVNGFEIPGRNYSSSPHALVIEDTCASCHLARPEGRYSLSPQVGGHSFYLKGEVHGSTKVNVAACSSCHEGIGQEGEFFGVTAKADYDDDGTIEVVQAEVEGLLHLIVNSEGTGVLQTSNPPAYRPDGSWNSTRGLEFPVEIVAAVWNYKFVEEDRSIGVHNTKYAVQLLMDTVGHFDSSFDMSNRPR